MNGFFHSFGGMRDFFGSYLSSERFGKSPLAPFKEGNQATCEQNNSINGLTSKTEKSPETIRDFAISQPPFLSGFGKPQTSSILRMRSSVLVAVSQSVTFSGLPIFLICAPISDSGWKMLSRPVRRYLTPLAATQPVIRSAAFGFGAPFSGLSMISRDAWVLRERRS